MKKNILNIIIVILVIIVVLLGGYLYLNTKKDNNSNYKNIEKNSTVKKENIHPNSSLEINTTFNLKAINGKEFNIQASRKKMYIEGMDNKIVFLKIFGWDCQFCKKEIPQLIKLKKELGDKLEVIAIEAQQHSTQDAKKYIKEYGINYYIVNGENQKRFYKYLKKYYGWDEVIPVTIVIGKGGKILAFEVGKKSYTLSELMKASLMRNKE
jgi:thiol-disulfide isomerase/thioredoxin